jgi:hypothetical protein
MLILMATAVHRTPYRRTRMAITVVTAGQCYVDLPLLSVAVGHHFVDQAITKAQGAWNSVAGQFFRRWTTGGPLKNPGVHTGDPKAARLNTQQIQVIVDKYKELGNL